MSGRPRKHHSMYEKSLLFEVKGPVSSSIPCMCRLLADLCLSPFSWPMKMVITKANQETTHAWNAG